jgi:signal transduction histidine kinase
MALTLGPVAAIGYFGYQSIVERERTLQASYSSLTLLARDRLIAVIREHEAALPATLGTSASSADSLQTWLRAYAKANPWAAAPFVIRADGSIVTEFLTRDWPMPARTPPSPATAAAMKKGEAAEFGHDDFPGALQSYREAMNATAAPTDRAEASLRVARVLAKMHRDDEALAAFRALAALPDTVTTPHGIPYGAYARLQMMEAATARPEATAVAQDFVTYVRDRVWDDRDGGYSYFVREAARVAEAQRLDVAATKGLEDALRHADAITNVAEHLQPRLGSASPAAAAGVAHRITIDSATGTAPVFWRFSTDATGATLATGFVENSDYLSGPVLARIISDLNASSWVQIALEREPGSGVRQPLARAPLGDGLPGWSVTAHDAKGRTLQQLASTERWTYASLLAAVLAVLVAGIVWTTRAWAREAELSRLQADFVANVSHELKTPLALIRMFGETLESGLVADPTKQKEFHGIIRRESERLTHLINNVLDTATIEAGTKRFAFEDVDLVALVREALDAYAPLFSRMSFTVSAALPDQACGVRIDRNAVSQAIVNLFQNAIRYSQDARELSVAVGNGGNEVTVSVRDRGIGIAPADLPHIFDKFYRVGRNQDLPAGSGLGLSIVKHVMTAHGGRVDVRSAPGEGSEFTLVFPAQKSAA